MECTMDCGCTVTSIRLGGTSNRRLASMTSSPLFINVDELMVTTGPIFQVGWFNACSGVMSVICSRFQPRNGPPEAVTTSFDTSPCVPERNDCQMAECSESTGLICCARTVRRTADDRRPQRIPCWRAPAAILPAVPQSKVQGRWIR